MNRFSNMSRRRFLAGGSGVAIAGACGGAVQMVLPDAASAMGAKVVIKYDWLMSNGQIGDVVAAERGLYEAAGLDVEFAPGGPNSATVPPVISGAATLGQFSETPQLFNARAGGVPVRILACGYRTGPYALTSRPEMPLRNLDDLQNVRVGIQPTARFLIDAIAAKHGIPIENITVVPVGFDKSPLVAGEVDAIGGWITNTQALSVVGDDRIDLLVSDLGLESYADVYFATDDAVDGNAEQLAAFIGATAQGWGWVHANPSEAVEIMVGAVDGLDLGWELKTIDLVLRLSFDEDTARDGWGTFDPASLEAQLALYDQIGQYPNGRPSLEEVHTTTILEMTADMRPKLGAPA
ncbi:MAG: ABC transporter substrate-binding protein [Boseongicola sp.]|nr:ABC transporter substrate-binding protein [Boseongicola sp.]